MLRYVQLFVSDTACVWLISCCIYTAPVSQSSSRPGDACAARAATPHRFRTPLLHLSAPPPRRLQCRVMVPAGISPTQGQRLQNQNVAAQILTWVSPFWSLQVNNIFVKTGVDPLSISFNKLIGWLLKRWLTYTQIVIYIDTKNCFIDLTPIYFRQ